MLPNWKGKLWHSFRIVRTEVREHLMWLSDTDGREIIVYQSEESGEWIKEDAHVTSITEREWLQWPRHSWDESGGSKMPSNLLLWITSRHTASRCTNTFCFLNRFARNIRLYLHTCMYVWMNLCMHKYLYVYVCTHVCMCVLSVGRQDLWKHLFSSVIDVQNVVWFWEDPVGVVELMYSTNTYNITRHWLCFPPRINHSRMDF